MTQSSKLCYSSPLNNHILFFDGHDSHFKNSALRQMMCKNIQPFVLKSGDSISNQTNHNGPNAKLKYLYKMAKSAWILTYEMTKFTPHHMNSVLVEAWYSFNISVGSIIRNRYSKTKLPPFIPLNLTTNTQACAASIQVSSGSKA